MSFTVRRDDRSAAFLDAAADGRLLIRRCPTCATAHAPHQQRCRRDGAPLGWDAASGEATLVTWAVDHSTPLDPELATPDGARSAYGYVELAEGPWLQAPIVGVNPAELKEGAALSVRFVRPGGGEAIPAFTAVAS